MYVIRNELLFTCIFVFQKTEINLREEPHIDPRRIYTIEICRELNVYIIPEFVNIIIGP